MRTLLTLAALVMLPSWAMADDAKKEKKVDGPLSFTMKGIDGKEVELSKFKGKVVMFVNVASECGLTKQYKGLQELHEKYNKKGLVIVGVPANEFGAQEPGTDKEIAAFCKDKYNVSFVMLSKVVVKGDGICPLYAHLTSKTAYPKTGGDIGWNFAKFLIGRDGKVVARFEPTVNPLGKEITQAIETELEKKES